MVHVHDMSMIFTIVAACFVAHSQKEGDVRLVGNTTVAVSSGLLEVFHKYVVFLICWLVQASPYLVRHLII